VWLDVGAKSAFWQAFFLILAKYLGSQRRERDQESKLQFAHTVNYSAIGSGQFDSLPHSEGAVTP
jgi:hypothetical protein